MAFDRFNVFPPVAQGGVPGDLHGSPQMAGVIKPCLLPVVLVSLFPSIGVGQLAGPAASSSQSTGAQQRPDAQQANTVPRPEATKPPAPSAAQQFVKHGARDRSTACNAARIDKRGQLDCGMHGKAAKPNPR